MSNLFNATFQMGSDRILELAKECGLKFDENLYRFANEIIKGTSIPPVRDEDMHSKMDLLIDLINEKVGGEPVTLREAMEIGNFKKCRTSTRAVRKFLNENDLLIRNPATDESWTKRITDQSAN